MHFEGAVSKARVRAIFCGQIEENAFGLIANCLCDKCALWTESERVKTGNAISEPNWTNLILCFPYTLFEEESESKTETKWKRTISYKRVISSNGKRFASHFSWLQFFLLEHPSVLLNQNLNDIDVGVMQIPIFTWVFYSMIFESNDKIDNEKESIEKNKLRSILIAIGFHFLAIRMDWTQIYYLSFLCSFCISFIAGQCAVYLAARNKTNNSLNKNVFLIFSNKKWTSIGLGEETKRTENRGSKTERECSIWKSSIRYMCRHKTLENQFTNK